MSPPDLIAVVDAAVAEAGGVRVDLAGAVRWLIALFHLHAYQGLCTLARKDAADALEVILRRPDLSTDMLFDYLTMLGPGGVVLHNQIVMLFDNRGTRESLVQAVRAA
ncbi:hypothetical protein JOF53_005747 [Crossiella equi]|uniref:Uncharacterized protein n=1 Tax=Crossiella equi TaxID=130796 RepID=A0ABS5AMF1_9PSEU|nr:hypothetical protein [Crossiella equi]MBP2476875.1 hypothetical protein [Crossiella equi]